MVIYVTSSKISPNLEALDVLEDREKSWKVRSRESGRVCFLPKSGLKPRKPGVPSYEDEFILAPWFRMRMSRAQAVVCGIEE